MSYKKFFEENDLKLDIKPPLFETCYNKIHYFSENDNQIIVKVPLLFRGTLSVNSLNEWIRNYPDLKELEDSVLNAENFQTKRDGKIYPYIGFNIEQEIFLYLNKKEFDKIVSNPKDFELDVSMMDKVELNSGEYKFTILGTQKVIKKAQKVMEKALDFPMKNYNDIFDSLVKVN